MFVIYYRSKKLQVSLSSWLLLLLAKYQHGFSLSNQARDLFYTSPLFAGLMASGLPSPTQQQLPYRPSSGASTPAGAPGRYSTNPGVVASPPAGEAPLAYGSRPLSGRAQSVGQLSRMSAMTTRSLYSDYHQHRVHKTLNKTKLGPGRVPFRNGIICVSIATGFVVAGLVLLFVYKFHRLTGMSDKEEFIPIMLIAIGVAAYGISIWFFYEARKKSNAFRSKLRFKPRPATSETVSVVNIAYEPEKTDLESLKSGSVTERAVTNVSYNPSVASNTLSSRAAYAGAGGSLLPPPSGGRWSAQPPSVRGGISAGSLGGYNQYRTTPVGPPSQVTRTQVYAYQNMGYSLDQQGLASGSATGNLMASQMSRPGSMNSQVSYGPAAPGGGPYAAGLHPLVAATFAAQNPIPPEAQPKDTAL